MGERTAIDVDHFVLGFDISVNEDAGGVETRDSGKVTDFSTSLCVPSQRGRGQFRLRRLQGRADTREAMGDRPVHLMV
jgi:hypothetical protein